MTKKLTMIFGIVFIVIGLLGFIANPIVGTGAFFEANGIHNFVHILSGIVFLIVASKSDKASSTVLTVFGVVYLLVTILGFFAGESGSILGLLTINGADNILHLVLAVAFLAVGLGNRSKMSAPMA